MIFRPVTALAFTLSIFAGSLSQASAAEPLDIPAILPSTGPAAFLGREFGEILHILEDRANRAGGIKGRPIRFIIQDDQSTPQVAVQLTNAAIAKNPPLIINGGPLALCAASMPLVKDGPMLLCLSPSAQPEPGSYVFAVTSSSRDCLISALNYYKGRGFKRIGILNGTDATGADADMLLADIIKQPEFAGLSFVANEHFNLADLSVSAQIARIKSTGAQALIAYTTGTQLATVLHGMNDGALDIPVFTSGGNMSITQLDGYKTFLPRELLFPGFAALASDSVSDREVSQKIVEFKADMKAANLSADMLHGIPWDPILLIVDGFKRAGPNATAQQLRNSLANVQNWPGIFGRYDYRAVPNRGIGLKALVVSRWDPNRSTWIVASRGPS
jgi:branched-chain amino acid transport system substrate-binding protein